MIETLKQLGFSHRYKPNLKKVDFSSLGYPFVYKEEVLFIELRYVEIKNKWVLGYIHFSGDETLNLLKENLKGCSLEEIITFVKKIQKIVGISYLDNNEEIL